MPGPLTKSVCVLYLTFSRANSMLCLPSARCPAGTGGCLPAGGGSRASHGERWAGSVWRACPCCLVQPLSARWSLGTGGGRRAGHGRDVTAVTSLCHCLWCVVQSGPHLALRSPRAPAQCDPTAPSTWGALWWLWHAWGTLHAESSSGCLRSHGL